MHSEFGEIILVDLNTGEIKNTIVCSDYIGSSQLQVFTIKSKYFSIVLYFSLVNLIIELINTY